MPSADLAVSIRGLSKAYRITQNVEKHSTAAEALLHRLRHPLEKPATETFWALNDVSFDVPKGQVIGIIGRNGAGKSTMLKVLSRITEPTRGEIKLFGRVGSLLEVGTGFHPELTGRENIYLNGNILGMRRKEIDRQFDAIVEFGGIEKFLDTPVKRYSSGMYVRLAFAVAAHLNPEILIIDEVLAVGDSEFQQKCLGKMRDVAGEGRTVLFVTHNMAIVQTLCRRAILLRGGQVVADGPPEEVVGSYLRSMESVKNEPLAARQDRKGKGNHRLTGVEAQTCDPLPSSTLACGRPARFFFHFDHAAASLSCAFTIYDHYGVAVTGGDTSATGTRDQLGEGATYVCEVDELTLVPGRYRINVRVMNGFVLEDHVEGACFFEVTEGSVGGRPIPFGYSWGHVALPHRWCNTPALPDPAVR